MEVDGPPRMVGWITWSGRERSSQTQFLPVPGVWLIHPIYKSLFVLVFILTAKICITLLCHPEALTAFYWSIELLLVTDDEEFWLTQYIMDEGSIVLKQLSPLFNCKDLGVYFSIQLLL